MDKIKGLVTGYVDEIWNGGNLDRWPEYLHPDFIDHSLPFGAQNTSAALLYLSELQKGICHFTEIENISYGDGFAILKIKMTLTPLLCSRENNLQPETLIGFRILAIAEQKIIAHWEFLETR